MQKLLLTLKTKYILKHTRKPIPTANHIYDNNGNKLTLDHLLKTDNKKLNQALSNEFGCLTQSNYNNVRCTDAMDFIHPSEIPPNEKITYASFICDHRPLKPEKWRTHLVIGGDKLPYYHDAGSPDANLIKTKLLLNSIILDTHQGARFLTLDLKDHFLASPMPNPVYMKIPSRYIPTEIMTKYNLQPKIQNHYIYCKIKKGMYGLKQAALLAYNFLKHNLIPHGYAPIPHASGLWKHTTCHIIFCLCIDDFGIKYYNKDDAIHLITTLQQFYKVSIDWSSAHYCGLNIKWNNNQ